MCTEITLHLEKKKHYPAVADFPYVDVTTKSIVISLRVCQTAVSRCNNVMLTLIFSMATGKL